MRLSDYLKLGGKNFKRNGYKTVLPILIITIGIVLFNVFSGFFTTITAGTEKTVTDNNSLRFVKVSSFKENGFHKKEFDTFRKMEGVVTAFPNVRNSIVMYKNRRGYDIELIGINPEAVSYFTSGERTSISGSEVILDSALSNDFKVGEKVPINYQVKLSETEVMMIEKQSNIQSFYKPFYLSAYPSEISSISLASIDFVEQLKAEFEKMTLSEYRKKNPYSSAVVIAKTVDDVPVIGEKLDEMGYITDYALKSSDGLPMVAKIIVTIGGLVILILLFSSGVSVASVIGNALQGRYKEIGMLRALGFERVHLMKLFSIEIAYVACISFVSSILCSFLCMRGVQYVVNSYYLKESSYPFALSMDINKVYISLLLIVIVSFFASIRPMLKASSVNITDIIRGDVS